MKQPDFLVITTSSRPSVTKGDLIEVNGTKGLQTMRVTRVSYTQIFARKLRLHERFILWAALKIGHACERVRSLFEGWMIR